MPLANTENNNNAEVSMHDLLDLPPLPAIANILITQALNDDIEFDEIATTIESDPALSARIIGLAQSSYFGDRSNIYTVKDAIQRALGLEMVKCIALSICLTEEFTVSHSHIFNLKVYWKNAIIAAETAKMLVPYLTGTKIEPQQAYLSGLLHNLGLLAMVYKFPEPMQKVYELELNNPEWTYSEIENKYLNIDHYQAGAMVADRWHLPEDCVMAIRYCPDEEYTGRHSELAQLVGFCVRFTQSRIYGGFEEENKIDIKPASFLKFSKDVSPILDRYLTEKYEHILVLSELLSGNG